MKTQLLISVAAACAFGTSIFLSGCGRANAQESGRATDRREIQLTVYKEDFALIHESRPVSLAPGRNRLRLDNVSKSLDPMSVIFDWKGTPQTPNVVSNTYDLGVASGGSLLKRLEGKPVEMLWNSQDGRPGEKIDGTLEASQEGGFVLRSGEKLYVNPNGTIVASGEQSLVTVPQLSAEIDSPVKEDAKLGMAYQTRGMSWSADYVARMTADGDALDMECWATLENHTGIDFPDAKITLIAGSPNRAVNAPIAGPEAQMAMKARETDTPAHMAEKPEVIGELYAYKVPALASIGQEQMNRVKMIGSTRVPIKKDYSIRINNAGYDYGYGYDPANPARQNAQLSITLTNDQASGLGMPLPAGAVRVYDETSSDSTAYIGAAGIGDTPKNQHVSLTLSKVFDVYCESRTISGKKVDKHTVRKTFEVVLHNEKKIPVDVRLVQSFYNKKLLVRETDAGKQIDAETRQWILRIGAGGTKTVTWTADFSN